MRLNNSDVLDPTAPDPVLDAQVRRILELKAEEDAKKIPWSVIISATIGILSLLKKRS